MDWSVVFQIVIGALISAGLSAGFVIWMENLRKPRLGLRIAVPVDVTYTSHPANKARYLGLMIENKQLPRWAKWLSRNAAIHCSGSITFNHLDGQNVFGRSMQARWWGSREPLPILAVAKGLPLIQILDPVRLSPEMHRDIYSGGSEQLDVAVRFDNDVECYGWCDNNYLSNPQWRNPDWKLDKGRYLVKVEVISAGERCVGLFRLINDGPVSSFRLEKALAEDYTRLNLAQKA